MTNIIKMSINSNKPLSEDKKKAINEEKDEKKKELYKEYLHCSSDTQKTFHECNEILKIINQVYK